MVDDDGSMQAILAHCASLPLQRFEPGEILLAEGPATDRMYILVSGEAEVLRGDTQVADIAQPGAVFGEMAALIGGAHTATVRAVTALEAYRVDGARALLRGNNEISFHVACILARRLKDATTYLADMKQQFAHRSDHFAMVDQVLDALVQRQQPSVAAGSTLTADPRL